MFETIKTKWFKRGIRNKLVNQNKSEVLKNDKKNASYKRKIDYSFNTR